MFKGLTLRPIIQVIMLIKGKRLIHFFRDSHSNGYNFNHCNRYKCNNSNNLKIIAVDYFRISLRILLVHLQAQITTSTFNQIHRTTLLIQTIKILNHSFHPIIMLFNGTDLKSAIPILCNNNYLNFLITLTKQQIKVNDINKKLTLMSSQFQ